MKLVHLSLTDKGAADAHRLRPALTLEEGDGAHEGARCFIPLLAHFIPCRDDTSPPSQGSRCGGGRGGGAPADQRL